MSVLPSSVSADPHSQSTLLNPPAKAVKEMRFCGPCCRTGLHSALAGGAFLSSSHFKATSEYPLMTKTDTRALPAAWAEPLRHAVSTHPTPKPGKYRMCGTYLPFTPPLFPFLPLQHGGEVLSLRCRCFLCRASSDRSRWRTFVCFCRNPANLREGIGMKYESVCDSDVSDLLLTMQTCKCTSTNHSRCSGEPHWEVCKAKRCLVF